MAHIKTIKDRRLITGDEKIFAVGEDIAFTVEDVRIIGTITKIGKKSITVDNIEASKHKFPESPRKFKVKDMHKIDFVYYD